MARSEPFTEVAFDKDRLGGDIVNARILGQANGQLLAERSALLKRSRHASEPRIPSRTRLHQHRPLPEARIRDALP